MSSILVAIPPPGTLKSNVSIPRIAQGVVNGTMIQQMNNKLVHVCDFANDLKKNGALKRFLIAQFAEIQKGIRAVLRFLGVSDLSGTLSSTASWLRGLANEILDFKRRILDPILDFEKEVLGYVVWANAMIAYIKSLPARLYALLQGCLLKILNSIANILVDAFSTIENPFTDVAQAVKEVATAVAVTTQEVITISATGQTIVTLADSAVAQLVPPSVTSAISKSQGTASSANTLLSAASSNNYNSVSSSLALVSQPLTPSTQAEANTAANLLISSLPTAANVASENTQSNSSKKSTP